MEICITATSDSLESKVDRRFGRCKFFLFVDPAAMQYRAVSNPALGESGGAGIKAATTVLKYTPAAVITGLIGDNALNILKTSSTKVYSCEDMTVREAVEMYCSGELKSVDAPNNR
jgi:predicted Fe-Mo cluster-binding NifX family protein